MKTTNEEQEDETHESWGLLQISRCQGQMKPLFASSIRHQNTIRLRIVRAARTRNLNQEWYRDKEHLIEVEMSAVQWAEAITHMNCGIGTPCTLLRIQREAMTDCPDDDQRTKIQDEFAGNMREVSSRFVEAQKRIQELLSKKGALTVAEKEEITKSIHQVRRMIDDVVPFVHSQFNEAIDKTVTQAKGEIESFYTHAVMNAGMAALGIINQKPEVPLLESKQESKPSSEALSSFALLDLVEIDNE